MQPMPATTQGSLAMMVAVARRAGIDRELGGDVVGGFVLEQGGFEEGGDAAGFPVHGLMVNRFEVRGRRSCFRI